jgi:hypothetical protein
VKPCALVLLLRLCTGYPQAGRTASATTAVSFCAGYSTSPSESVTTILHPSLAKIRALASVNRMLCCFILTVKSSRSATIWYAISLNPNSFSRISEPAFGLLLLTSICWEDDY